MILAIRYTVKGVKKGYKKYQAHQLEKEQAAKGIMPNLDDPSRELDVTCQAERRRTSTESSRSSNSSKSTLVAEKALENDPEFQKYMDRHRSLYIQQQRGLPPSYDVALNESLTTTPSTSLSSPHQSMSTVPDGEHCTCHNCVVLGHSRSPMPDTNMFDSVVPEMPASTTKPAELDVPHIRINNGSHILSTSSSQDDKDDLILCEMPGDLPAILPDFKSRSPSELPAAPV